MGSRGGGRGRGRFGGGGFRFAKQEPYLLFPDIELPAIDKEKVKNNLTLVKLRVSLQKGLKDLPYFLEEKFAVEEETVDIERYSDRKRKGSGTKITLENSGYLLLQPGYFPLELVRGTKRRTGRKVQWNPKRDLKKLDFLEVLEGKFKDEEGKKRNEGDEEEEEEEVEVEEEFEDESDNDYYQNKDFDDDEDDFNPPENDDDDDPIL